MVFVRCWRKLLWDVVRAKKNALGSRLECETEHFCQGLAVGRSLEDGHTIEKPPVAQNQ